jgi:hypothetical protein
MHRPSLRWIGYDGFIHMEDNMKLIYRQMSAFTESCFKFQTQHTKFQTDEGIWSLKERSKWRQMNVDTKI